MENKQKSYEKEHSEPLQQTDVICRWKFFYEGEEDGWHFFIEAKDYIEAFEKAYDTHGPQVESMMYYNVYTNGI